MKREFSSAELFRLSCEVRAHAKAGRPPMTAGQKRMYDALCRYHEQHSTSPTLRELGNALGLSSLATVHKHLTWLREKGYVSRRWNLSRSTQPIDPDGLMDRAADALLFASDHLKNYSEDKSERKAFSE